MLFEKTLLDKRFRFKKKSTKVLPGKLSIGENIVSCDANSFLCRNPRKCIKDTQVAQLVLPKFVLPSLSVLLVKETVTLV